MKKNNTHGLSNILFNILIPVMILNKGSRLGLSPVMSLIIALSFPLFFTIKSLVEEKKADFISLLGLLNILISGTLTLLSLGGIWFAIKEAAFPLLIGLFVLGSSFTDRPFFKSLFLNPAAFDTEKIEASLTTETHKNEFQKLMIKATRWLSLSFLMSSLLNFLLAIYIFKPLNETLSELEKQETLNTQLSHMTLYSLLVILIPSMIFLGLIMYFAFKKIKEITQLGWEDLIQKN